MLPTTQNPSCNREASNILLHMDKILRPWPNSRLLQNARKGMEGK